MAARRIVNKEYREAGFAIFVIGVALFMSLFSLAVAEDTRFYMLRATAVSNAQDSLASARPLGAKDISQLLLVADRKDSEDTEHVIFGCTLVLAIIFILAGFAMRDHYASGEDF